MDTLVEREANLYSDVRAIQSRIDSGEITLAEGTQIILRFFAEIHHVQGEMEDMKDKGYKWYELLLGLLTAVGGSVVTSLTGVRLWRGSVNNRAGNIGKV